MNKIVKNNILFGVIMISLFLTGCSNNTDIPFPANYTGFTQPQTRPFSLSSGQPIKWVTVNTDSIAPVYTSHFNFDTIRAKPFDVNNPKPLDQPLDEVKFNWNSLPEKPFDINKLPEHHLKFKTSVLPKPQILKAVKPHSNEGNSRGVMEIGIDQSVAGKAVYYYKNKQGIMWIGTEKGLCIYDGNQCSFYASTNDPVLSIFEAGNGEMWIGTMKGLFVADLKAGLVKRLVDSTLTGNSFYGIMQDNSGRIWATANAFGVLIIDTKEQTFREFGVAQGLAGQFSVRIMQDRQGLIWINAVDNKGVTIIDLKAGKIKYLKQQDGLTNNNSISTFQDDRGRIWIHSVGGIDIIDKKNSTIQKLGIKQSPLLSGIGSTVLQDQQKNYWITTDSNLVLKYNESQGTLQTFTLAGNSEKNLVFHLLADSLGNIWASLNNAGGFVINGENGFAGNYAKASGLADMNIWALHEDRENNIWIGTFAGIDIYNPSSASLKHIGLTHGVSNKHIQSLVADSKGRILATGGNAGIDMIDTRNGTVQYINKDQGLKSNDGTSLLVDKKGTIWMGTNDGVLSVVDLDNKIVKNLYDLPEFKDNRITTLRADWNGNIWAGIIGGGVDVIDADAKMIRHLDTSNGLSSNVVYTLMEDRTGNIWIGTDKGIDVANLQNNTITVLTEKTGLAAPGIFTLTEKDGRVYAGTSKGLTVISPPSAQDSLQGWKMRSFGKEQGLSYLDFAENADLLTKRGQFWWGVENQTLLVMDDPIFDTVVAPVYVTGINVMDKPAIFDDRQSREAAIKNVDTVWNLENGSFYAAKKIPEDPEIVHEKNITWNGTEGPYKLPVNLKLPYTQNYLAFRFNAASLSNTDKLRYRYLLQGIDKNWSDVTANNFSENYRDLPTGNYVFKVSSKGMNGKWSTPAAFKFSILPPWWRSWWAYLIYAAIILWLVRAYIQYRSARLRKENVVLEQKINERTNELKKSIEELKATQAQLIQSEKMASLGELTAGIAHEIQNPLNFVNNFSDVSRELIDEMNEELEKGDVEEAKFIAADIKQNLEKINHHGKRADSIVRGMLEHSRTSSGAKEPTDINKLCDEFIRLSYHGLRAKDKSFNSEIITRFDESVEKIDIVAQDIGRVILNLVNNAFYAVHEKAKSCQSAPPERGVEDYKPFVTVTTKKENDHILISVADNGNGIPEKIKDRIFNPFFTTKPTGQGTGLGLSLSYDIVKAHGGEIKVESEDGKGTQFIIIIPAKE